MKNSRRQWQQTRATWQETYVTRSEPVADDLGNLHNEVIGRIASYFHRDDLAKRNPYRPEPMVREEQKRWIPHRKQLRGALHHLETAKVMMAVLSAFLVVAGYIEWVAEFPRIASVITCFTGSALSFLLNQFSKKAKALREYIGGQDRLYQLPLRCDECDLEYSEPKVNKCGKCESCPRCAGPLDPPSRIEQCGACQRGASF